MSIYYTFNLRATVSGNFLSDSIDNYFSSNKIDVLAFQGYNFYHFLGVLREDRRLLECHLSHLVVLKPRLYDILSLTLDEYGLKTRTEQMNEWVRNEHN